MQPSKPSWRDKWEGMKQIGKRWNFENDGCSNSPDLNFRECCEEHDFYYRNDTGVSRAEADRRLRICIQKRWHLPLLPWVYWGATRLFGWRPWNKARKKD